MNQSDKYMEVKVHIKRELYEKLMENIKIRGNERGDVLSDIVNKALEEYVMANVNEDKISSRKTMNRRVLKEYIEKRVYVERGPVKIELIVEELERDYGIKRNKTIEIIEKMLKEGILYQPKPGYIMPT